MIKNIRRSFLLVIVALLLVLTVSIIQSEASVNVNVGINLPPYRFAAPPNLVVIPGTYVYMIPDIDIDVFFYQGYWWRPYKGRWYRSMDYKGRWHYIEPKRIPRRLRALPQDYRFHLSPDRYERIPHGQVKKNWKKWEKERYWDRRDERGRGRQDKEDRRVYGEQKGRY